jgi:hypothetical protein
MKPLSHTEEAIKSGARRAVHCLEAFAPVSYPLAFLDVILGSSAIRVSRELAAPDLEEVVFTLGSGYPTSWSLYPYTG